MQPDRYRDPPDPNSSPEDPDSPPKLETKLVLSNSDNASSDAAAFM
jgi:hypothetical protein